MKYAGEILVGISGGVDSAVAAWRLQAQGFHVRGLFMKNWEEDDKPGYCAAAADLASAQAVAKQLGIELLTVNFATEYWERVFTYFLAEYQAGRTPNPDVLCNSEIKFRAFLEYALERGATGIATGHYARIDRNHANYRLCLAADADKDQTYFLHRLNQAQLHGSQFPLASLTKTAVRHLAQTAGLPNYARRDSTGICFIGERRLQTFLARYLPAQPGNLETPDGRIVGRHRGLMYHTIGQRQGLGIGGLAGADAAPWFVADKDLSRNILIVVQGHTHPYLLHQHLAATQLHWIAGTPPALVPFNCQARVRHRQPLQNCQVLPEDITRCRIRFERPQWALAPGQAVVLYQQGECLGGGVIERAWNE